ncbi:ricin B-like lectin [Mycena maculata]|uniref:Ricin B-like lectin n=1 Tax=Mycena maculata TaxID=230809 RepID=A0AAD7JT71_9AGAR|nr:ricin B-like lectin [Mycena maculata]
MPEIVQSGRIINAKSGTAMDLSGGDNKYIIGYPYHDGTNQHWTLTWTGNSWTFRSESSGLYLGLAGAPADGTRLIAMPTPVEFDIWHDEQDPANYRIFVPNTNFNFDLYGDGDSTPGTPITLWYKWAGIHQTWSFERGKCFWSSMFQQFLNLV